MKRTVHVKRVSSQEERNKAFSIRVRVFVEEQGVPENIELDREDDRALHLLAFVDEKAVGTARVVMGHGSAKIGRMAVLKGYRNLGVGKKLLKRATLIAKKQDAEIIYLHAQVPVIGFYETMGFRYVGPVFREAGIPHLKMILTRPKSRPSRHLSSVSTKSTSKY